MGVPWGPERGSEREGKPGASVWRMVMEHAEDGFSAAEPFCSASKLQKLQATCLALKQCFTPTGPAPPESQSTNEKLPEHPLTD